MRLSFYFKNTDAENSFYFREIGLFAKDPDTNEKILYAYANAGTEAEYINNSITINNTKTIDIDVVIDNASEITVELEQPTPYATKEELRMLQQKQLEYTPRYETTILVVSNWIQNEETGNYEYTITNSKVTANHLIEGYADLENMAKLSNSYTSSFNGGYKIVTSALPTENITIHVSIQKMILETEESAIIDETENNQEGENEI